MNELLPYENLLLHESVICDSRALLHRLQEFELILWIEAYSEIADEGKKNTAGQVIFRSIDVAGSGVLKGADVTLGKVGASACLV
jgi:hypothetical protein